MTNHESHEKHTRTNLIVASVLVVVALGVGVVLQLRADRLGVLTERRVRIPKDFLLEDVHTNLHHDLTTATKKISESTLWKEFVAEAIEAIHDDVTTLNLAINGIEVCPGQFPDRPSILRAIEDCVQILGFSDEGDDGATPERPRVYIVNKAGLNAYTTNISEPVVVLHSEMLRRFETEAELRFIIGHEMGHILCQHVLQQSLARLATASLGPIGLDKVLIFPVLEWVRGAEHACDRVGLVCCQDLEVAEQALIRLATGMELESSGRIDVDIYLQQVEAIDPSEFARLWELMRGSIRTHPTIPQRVDSLRSFASHDDYLHLWED